MKICTRAFVFILLLFHSVFFKGQSTSISGIINIYTPVSFIDTTGCKTKVTVGSATGFSAGDSVLIIQMKGANFDSTNTPSFGSVISLNGAGNYEIAAITSVSGNVIQLNGKLVNTYAISGFVQLVRIPTYVNATVTGSLTCQPWNGQTGGVLICSVQNTLQLAANIDVTGKGFRGGIVSNNPDGGCGTGSPDYYYDMYQGGLSWNSGGAQKGEGIGTISSSKQAGRGPLVTGGGGGNKHNTGGGGGSNYTTGGLGGMQLAGCPNGYPGIGGLGLSSFYASKKLFLGGGGGCGDANDGVGTTGANGGGIIIISAATMTGSFLVNGNGASVTGIGGGAADGAGGGGGGGTAFLNILNTGASMYSFSVVTIGGAGGDQAATYGCVGTGGGGGSGIILYNQPTPYLLYACGPGPPGAFTSNVYCSSVNYGATYGGPNPSGALVSQSLVHTPNSSFTLNTAGTSQTVCAGQPIYLNGTTGGYPFFWTGPASFNSTVQNPTITLATPANTGGYSLTLVPPGSCSVTVIYTVAVDPGPVFSIPNVSLCTGQGFTLDPGLPANYTYTWSGPNAFSSSASSINFPSANPSLAGVYNLTVTSSTGCTDTGTINVTVTSVTAPTVSATPAACAGDTLLFTASNGSGGFSYNWTGPGLSSAQQNTMIVNASVSNSGTYTLTANNNGCVITLVTPPVTVYDPPAVSISNAIFCTGQPVSLIASSPTGTGFEWTGPNGFTASTPGFTLSGPSNNLAGVYSVSVTNAAGCTNTGVTTVSIVSVPVPTLTSNSPVCVGGTLALNASGGTTYSYTGPGGFTSNLQNPTISDVNTTAGGIYTVAVSNVSFCPGAIATVSVTIFAANNGTLTSASNNQCAPFCPGLSAGSGSGGSTALISLFINGETYNGALQDYCINKPGNYEVRAGFKDINGCVLTSSMIITAYPKPKADFDFFPLTPTEDQDVVTFTNTSTGDQLTNWYWNFRNNSGYTSTTKNTSYTFDSGGNFPIVLRVKNNWGCEDTIIKPIIVAEDFSIYVPNTFTPNGDGLNDLFQAKGRGISKYSLEIFDRWGDKIFSTSDFFTGWDGSFKGVACKNDVYVWKINATNANGKKKELSGHVTLYK